MAPLWAHRWPEHRCRPDDYGPLPKCTSHWLLTSSHAHPLGTSESAEWCSVLMPRLWRHCQFGCTPIAWAPSWFISLEISLLMNWKPHQGEFPWGLVTFRASLSGTSLQTLPDLVTPLKGHSLSPCSCPATQSAFRGLKASGTNMTVEAT